MVQMSLDFQINSKDYRVSFKLENGKIISFCKNIVFSSQFYQQILSGTWCLCSKQKGKREEEMKNCTFIVFIYNYHKRFNYKVGVFKTYRPARARMMTTQFVFVFGCHLVCFLYFNPHNKQFEQL